ncbi:MAG: DEAD/DEAH box helicase [Caldilineaceae bacterium]|nr:DEAD/DEAH box helicase [Caldilineaceae bacterium]HRJ42158.1 DEAD/DEAH box helicase [Caldilineaceae bacterium]
MENDSPTTAETPNRLSDVSLETLPSSLAAAVSRAGWTKLMPVQARAIPYLLAEKNVMVQARTGSGKTGAFLLPMLERLNPQRKECQALILAPTRELARQVANEAEMLFAGTGLRTVAVYGGVGYGAQLEALEGGAQVVVGTPGRVLDHLLRRTFNLNRLEMLVFDEADRMLSMGFYQDMRQVQRYLPDRNLHTVMFSATFPAYVMRTAQEFMQNPEFLSLSQDHVHVTDTEHSYYIVPGVGRDRSLVRLIEVENPASAIIFCNTKAHVNYVTIVLQRFGYDADELSADLNQRDRENVLSRVREGSLRFLVATDVAARGLDIPELSHVFQYEPPEDTESYIHRAGRTGRAGASGTAITLANVLERSQVERISKRYSIPMEERTLPTEEEVAEVVTERLTSLLEARLRERDKLQTERSRRFAPLAKALAENAEESALITMLLDDTYQQMLHAPLVDPAEATQKSKPAPRRSPNRESGERSRSPRRSRPRRR